MSSRKRLKANLGLHVKDRGKAEILVDRIKAIHLLALWKRSKWSINSSTERDRQAFNRD